jgi:hypothetical protein
MTGSPESVDVQERLSELRRRLYRDGATEEDLRRYAEERDSLLGPQQAVSESADVAAAPRRRRLLLVGAAGAVVLAAIVGSVVTAGAMHPLAARPSPTAPAPVATGRPLDIGDGQTLVQDADVVTTPTSQLVSTDGAVATRQYQGTGNAVVPLDISTASFESGRAVVVLSADQASPMAWRALRLVSRRDWTSYQQVVAQGTVASRAGFVSPVLFDYVGTPPSHVAIEAPHGLNWTLLVAFTGGTASADGR